MKRVLLRLSALAVVVVLGLMAIAQAQRSVEGQSEQPAGGQPAVAADAGEQVAAGVGRGAAAAGEIDSRRNPSPGQDSNPLRAIPGSETGQLVPLGRTPVAAGEPAGQPNAPLPVRPTSNAALLSGPPTGAAIPDRAAPVARAPQAEGGAAGESSSLSLLGAPPIGPTGPVEGDEASEAPTNPGAASKAESAIGEDVPGTFSPDPQFPTVSLRSPESPGSPAAVAPAGPPAAAGAEGTGLPGSTALEGAQSPQLTIQKFAPASVRVGQPATFRILVRNTGQTPARDVQVQDEIPKGTRLIATKPLASRGVSGQLVWDLGTMEPGDEATLEVELMPAEEGEIGSVATVHFAAAASAKTVATKPELVVETEAPRQVLIGEEVVLKITVSNPGSGTATGVVLEERVPPALQHPAGTELEYEVGDLAPKESRQVELRLRAERPGPATNVLVARADGNLKAEDRLDLEVLAPQLAVHVEGPKRRYLEREATYIFSVENPGTAPAKNVDLVAYLPHGFRFVRANNAGYYDEKSHTVRWRLAELPVAEVGSVQLTAVPSEPGEHSLRFVSSTPDGLSAEQRATVQVEGIAALLFEVRDVEDPIEKGGQTTYEIQVVNQGSKAATNVRLTAVLPPQMRAVAAEGPPGVQYRLEGNSVVFDSLSRLAPKADTIYRIRVQGLQAGDLRINVRLIADELQDWVTKQESTRVYADE